MGINHNNHNCHHFNTFQFNCIPPMHFKVSSPNPQPVVQVKFVFSCVSSMELIIALKLATSNSVFLST